MYIYIKFNNIKYLLNVNEFQSIYSIVNKLIEEKNLNIDIDDVYLDYNGNYLSLDYSLDKYEIKNNYNDQTVTQFVKMSHV
jgi:hypothetical protein